MFGVVTFAATDTLSATITAQSISVTVVDGVVAYGNVLLSATQDTIALSDTQSAVNNGNVTIDLDIQGQNSTAWTLSLSAIGGDQYTHEISTNGGTTYVNFDASVFTGFEDGLTTTVSTLPFDLRISTPSSSTDFTVQTVSVTVQSTAN